MQHKRDSSSRLHHNNSKLTITHLEICLVNKRGQKQLFFWVSLMLNFKQFTNQCLCIWWAASYLIKKENIPIKIFIQEQLSQNRNNCEEKKREKKGSSNWHCYKIQTHKCLNPDSKHTCSQQLSASRISAGFSPLPACPPPPPTPQHECASWVF